MAKINFIKVAKKAASIQISELKNLTIIPIRTFKNDIIVLLNNK